MYPNILALLFILKLVNRSKFYAPSFECVCSSLQQQILWIFCCKHTILFTRGINNYAEVKFALFKFVITFLIFHNFQVLVENVAFAENEVELEFKLKL